MLGGKDSTPRPECRWPPRVPSTFRCACNHSGWLAINLVLIYRQRQSGPIYEGKEDLTPTLAVRSSLFRSEAASFACILDQVRRREARQGSMHHILSLLLELKQRNFIAAQEASRDGRSPLAHADDPTSLLNTAR